MADCPAEITRLVEQFGRNIDSYRESRYKEAQLRKEFIDPFFEALGWDTANRAGKAEAYKDVIHEASLKADGGTKAPDYCFRIGGTRKFFVETKKPSIDIATVATPAYQLRRYAWSAKLPLSILTDFEEFAIYDCRIRPKKTDRPAIARILYLKWQDYPEQWREIAGVFSKQAIEQGSFDKYVESTKRKRGTAEVDREFLAEIEKWRFALARNIALRNRRLTVDELNFAVQRTIDRIIFLRMCEDRGIEQYGQLQNFIEDGGIYSNLCTLYERADEKYNSGLFYFSKERSRGEPDLLTPSLNIDDATLKNIIGGLYYPDCPYEFSVLPAEILGNVYEQFLGKVIRLTRGHQAKVEDKPEVKKAGGVYYTPKYIVDYIVKNTVGKLCEGKTPTQISKLRILDPACGSGSFLIGAYTYLLNYHRDYYLQARGSDAEEERSDGKGLTPRLRKLIYRDKSGQWKLTTAEKKRILLNNIYGVDIDGQAVEVTKLSLLLKVLEGESGETLEQQQRLFHERALPDLSDNIKCGNSLIGPDYFDGQLITDAEEMRRINAFDWAAEFPDIFGRRGVYPERSRGTEATEKKRKGGFDAVIGNPPYVRVRYFKQDHPQEADYLESVYACAKHVWDIYLLFFERAVQLLRRNGLTSFIIPIQTLHQPNCESLRALLVEHTAIEIVADLSNLKVFKGAIVKNCILVCSKRKPSGHKIRIYAPCNVKDLMNPPLRDWPQEAVTTNRGKSLKVDLLSPIKVICDRIARQSWQLGDICYVTFGLRSCAKGKGKGGKDRLIRARRKTSEDKPYLEGRDIGRYSMQPTGRYIHYCPDEMYSPRSPVLFESHRII
ncbi:MAG: N-6 DNA methylase, partial [Planctomycetota bacterium]